MLEKIPRLGSGIGHRFEIADALEAHAHEIDVVEIIAERYFGPYRKRLEEIRARWPVIPHGISLSIGSPVDPQHLREMRKVVQAVDAPYYSDHLCFTRAPGLDIGHLVPIWLTEPILREVVDRVRRIQDVLEVPLVLETITEVFTIPNAQMRAADFFHRLVDETGCGILLDVANLHANSVNHGFDAEAAALAMPLDHVVHVHVAGGYFRDGVLVDGHCCPVMDRTWSLLELVASRAPIRALILEHDSDFPPAIDPLLAQVRRGRDILRKKIHS